jgi:hypothetical protein
MVYYFLLLVDLRQFWNDSNHRLVLICKLDLSPLFVNHEISCLAFTELSKIGVFIEHSAIAGMKETA